MKHRFAVRIRCHLRRDSEIYLCMKSKHMTE